jgi:hypothetical protein
VSFASLAAVAQIASAAATPPVPICPVVVAFVTNTRRAHSPPPHDFTGQTFAHEPQLSGSRSTSMHRGKAPAFVASHLAPAPHVREHVPRSHTSSVAQLLPHAPQFA